MISCWAKVSKYRKSSSPKQDTIVRWCKVAMMMCQQGGVIVCWSGASWRRKNNLCSSLLTVTLMLEKKTCYHYYRKHMRQQFQTICNVKSYCVGLKVQDQHPYRIRKWTDNSILSNLEAYYWLKLPTCSIEPICLVTCMVLSLRFCAGSAPADTEG